MIRVNDRLNEYADSGIIDALDVETARGLLRIAGQKVTDAFEVALGIAMASRAENVGHIRFDIARNASNPPQPIYSMESLQIEMTEAVKDLRWPSANDWLKALRGCSTLIRGASETRDTPLVLGDDACLYLDRYWAYENQLAGAIEARLADVDLPVNDTDWLNALLKQAIGENLEKDPDGAGVLGQRRALLMAMRKNFAVISGGPGTGKTTTVAALLAILVAMNHKAGGAPLKIKMMAPTGKASARMTESLVESVNRLRKDAKSNALDSDFAWALELIAGLKASTIHRALGANPSKPTYLKYNKNVPLPVDVVIVDEASMIDFALMAKLFAAVPDNARLILLGDREQLASVEAGAVLGDICGVGIKDRPGPSSETISFINKVMGTNEKAVSGVSYAGAIRSAVVQLEYSFRFRETGKIGRLAKLVRDFPLASEVDENILQTAKKTVRKVWSDYDAKVLEAFIVDTARNDQQDNDQQDVVQFCALDPQTDRKKGLSNVIAQEIVSRWEKVIHEIMALAAAPYQDEDIKRAIEKLGEYRVLCTNRKGVRGVENINGHVMKALTDKGVLTGTGEWVAGRPIMVLENDYSVNLFNGDVGLILPMPAGSNEEPDGATSGAETQLVAVFLSDDDRKFRVVPRGRMPRHETVFAMTIHKSQGSEFDHVSVILPTEDSDFLTRELLYTGITRAKKAVVLAGDEDVFFRAISRRVQRSSGLQARLWK